MDAMNPCDSPTFEPSIPPMKTLITSPALLLGLLALALPASARTINWGNTVDDLTLTSSTSLLDNSYTFELGSFGSFIPDQSNIEQWAANWKVFDQATFGNGKWDASSGFFSSTADLLTNGTSSASPPLPSFTFGLNEQAYIWVFNTQTLAVGTTEWALITNDSTDGLTTDDWKFPAPSDHSLTPFDWRLPDVSHVIWGGANNVQGPGDYTPPTGGFDLQTHTMTVVPEPSGALLIAITGMLIQLRRRSRSLA